MDEFQEKKSIDVAEKEENKNSKTKDSNEEVQTQDTVQRKDADQNIQEKEENPLVFFKEMVSQGVLPLVCQEENLSEEHISSRKKGKKKIETFQETDWYKKKDEINLLEGVLDQSDSLWSEERNRGVAEKSKLLFYASKMFHSYMERGEKHAAYGLEYLAAGNEMEKDNLAYVVNRLFFIRGVVNYAYVNQNPEFIKKSLATAQSVALLFMGEPFVPLIQQGILLVLALEEACVDVTALLQGRLVPFTKNTTNFQMTYEEICVASESLFQTKAKIYTEAGKNKQLKGIGKGFGYIHYLWLFLLMTSWEDLYDRSLDLIQDDLRHRFNESFEIEGCISGCAVDIVYDIPLLSPVLMEIRDKNIKENENREKGVLKQKIFLDYNYQ